MCGMSRNKDAKVSQGDASAKSKPSIQTMKKKEKQTANEGREKSSTDRRSLDQPGFEVVNAVVFTTLYFNLLSR